MGFSIGSFLGKIAGPVIGGLIGGPTGALIGGGISAGFAGPGGSVGPQAAVGPRRVFTDIRTGERSFLPGRGGSGIDIGGIGPQFPRVGQFGSTSFIARGIGATGIVGLIASLFATSRERTGQPINRNKVVAAVKHCGITLAAEIFALSETEICQIVISKGRRRGRGISAADLRRTRATLRKVHNIQHDLGRVKAVRRHHK